jgi:hypothetical protein
MVWTANRLPMSQPAVQMPSMSFTGSNAASIYALDAIKNARRVLQLALSIWTLP